MGGYSINSGILGLFSGIYFIYLYTHILGVSLEGNTMNCDHSLKTTSKISHT